MSTTNLTSTNYVEHINMRALFLDLVIAACVVYILTNNLSRSDIVYLLMIAYLVLVVFAHTICAQDRQADELIASAKRESARADELKVELIQTILAGRPAPAGRGVPTEQAEPTVGEVTTPDVSAEQAAHEPVISEATVSADVATGGATAATDVAVPSA